jgi:hypothetical protein
MATMTGAVLAGNRQLELKEFPIPEAGYGQVVIRILLPSCSQTSAGPVTSACVARNRTI